MLAAAVLARVGVLRKDLSAGGEVVLSSRSKMPLDPEFVADCPYAPGGLLIDEILAIDRDNGVVRVRMPTHDDLPLTREQRAHEAKHPRHVSGGLMVHMTGMVAFVHSYYVLGLRHADGWIGYGVRIHNARFHALARPGDPLILECKATRVRKTGKNIFAQYEFRFTQGEALVYEGEQSAMWQQMP
jgi:3-hydroxymyristoyl/3-hydroxydecanoyl-(acyl carrier protein) dehydratase